VRRYGHARSGRVKPRFCGTFERRVALVAVVIVAIASYLATPERVVAVTGLLSAACTFVAVSYQRKPL